MTPAPKISTRFHLVNNMALPTWRGQGLLVLRKKRGNDSKNRLLKPNQIFYINRHQVGAFHDHGKIQAFQPSFTVDVAQIFWKVEMAHIAVHGKGDTRSHGRHAHGCFNRVLLDNFPWCDPVLGKKFLRNQPFTLLLWLENEGLSVQKIQV